MSSDPPYPRDMVGYGRNPPHARWPGNARVAVQFVLNYEEGGESCVLHGDKASEQFLSEIIGAPAFEARHLSMESIYEYGSRAGVWRILREFERRRLPLTIFGVSMALERYPDLTAAFVESGHEIACHGWRWIHYQNMDEATEREHMRIGVEIIKHKMGADPGAVAYDACEAAKARGTDVLIVDTAGRLHTQDNLMRELTKIRDVVAKRIPGAPHEALLVLDATTGQNAILQAKNFNQAIGVTGIFLAKLDGTAKGGMILSIRDQLNIPVKFIGLGETPEDIETFDPQRFIDAMFEEGTS